MGDNTPKIAIEAQIEAMETLIVAEEMRAKGHVLREDCTQAEADDWLARLRSVLNTLQWCHRNRGLITQVNMERSKNG